MKIAALISGMPRFVERNANLMKNFFRGHEVDYFCHAWFDKDKEEETKSWHQSTIKIDPLTEEKIIEHYKPKNYLIEPQRQFEVPREYKFNTSWPQPFFIVYSHFYSIKVANQLRLNYQRETGVKYDMVVRLRYDMFIGTKINWHDFDLNNLYLHDNCNCWSELFDDVSFNDMFAFSNEKNMNVYCSTFDYLDKIYNENFVRFSCESLLAFHLISNNVQVIPVRFPRSYILRNGTLSYDMSYGVSDPPNDKIEEFSKIHDND